MTRHLRVRELILAVEGLALHRGMFSDADESAQRRVEEIRRAAADDGVAAGIEIPEVDVRAGYSRWSSTYDAPGNPLIAAEQPAVWALLEAAPTGRALDAACGTGRHAGHLVALGHDVVGVDATPEMLVRAREKVPEARFELGDLVRLPFESGEFDLAVCSPALDHAEDLNPPIAELARVVRPGGQVIVSDLHPVLAALGGAAFFLDDSGAAGVVRGYRHLHSEYLDAFGAAGLELRRCIEVPFEHEQVEMQQPVFSMFPDATEGAYLGLPAALIWDTAVGGDVPSSG